MMLFVRDTILPSPTTGNLPHSVPSLLMDDDSEDYMEDTLDDDDKTAGQGTTIYCNSVTSVNRRVLSSIPTSRTHPSFASGNSTILKLIYTLKRSEKKLDIITAGQNRDEELTSKPDYHFLISLLPYVGKLSPLQNLEVRRKIQDVVIQAYKRKEAQMYPELEISQLSVPAVQNDHSFTYNIPQY
jgi:hypothetical protein